MKNKIIKFSIERPKVVIGSMITITITLLLLVAIPSLFPNSFESFPKLKIDTDPENMLPHNESSRLFHDKMKKELELHEIVAVGVVHPTNAFNKQTLNNIYKLTNFAKTIPGIKAHEIMSPSTLDNIEQGMNGEVKFSWLMDSELTNEEEALKIKKDMLNLPFLKGTIASEDGLAIGLYLPITSKKESYNVYQKLNKFIENELKDTTENYHIAGLPVAEDTFGVEMFIQMGISAPASMLIIFILMFLFFRNLTMITSPMIVALVSVIVTMSILILTGNTVHIMSSMIPIFIMPIAVLDSVHILSDFFDNYQKTKDKKKTITHVMESLFNPMMFTSLTTIAGFSSLALTPNPPVQVFGIFTAVGVFFAWFFTILFIPSFIMSLSDKTLSTFGSSSKNGPGKIDQFLMAVSRLTIHKNKQILGITLILVGISIYGISKIKINDNPTRWFAKNHPIRVADKVMNEHLAGTYMSYLAIEVPGNNTLDEKLLSSLQHLLFDEDLKSESQEIFNNSKNTSEFLSEVESVIEDRLDDSESDQLEEKYNAVLDHISNLRSNEEIFKNSTNLKYIEGLQAHLEKLEVVGKTSSISELVKTVHRELLGGGQEHYYIPENSATIAQTLITYQSGHRPNDLWHFVTPDYKKASIWIQLKSGNNDDMQLVVDTANKYFIDNNPPNKLEHRWFGLTYINLIWQNSMVVGMLEAFLGSFVIVLIMMTFLFRSLSWGILSMVPLSVTITLIYGLIGLVGKEYDMPVAVLSSLSLGLAVDYAIHFLARTRSLRSESKDVSETIFKAFGEPARAIFRNIIVVGFGFFPLLLSPLVPYQTVGALIALILLSAGFITLFVLPSIITLLPNYFFKVKEQ